MKKQATFAHSGTAARSVFFRRKCAASIVYLGFTSYLNYVIYENRSFNFEKPFFDNFGLKEKCGSSLELFRQAVYGRM